LQEANHLSRKKGTKLYSDRYGLITGFLISAYEIVHSSVWVT